MAYPFLLSTYQFLLETALRNSYQFLGFDQIGKESSSRSCLLRHDIDSELWSCLPMAEIETSLKIQATYFVMTRSTAYNLFCLESLRTIDSLLKGGHQIALHFMGELIEQTPLESYNEKVLTEVDWLEKEFEIKIAAVSFHQPSEFILRQQLAFNSLINTYNKKEMRDYFYISDSNMIWKHEHPIDIFSHGMYERLQLLIHPIWWTDESLTTNEKWHRVLNFNNATLIQHWQERERSLEKNSFHRSIDEKDKSECLRA